VKAQAATATTCGTFNLAVNPWVGYEANAAVLAYVAEKNLGCRVVQEGPQGRGFLAGLRHRRGGRGGRELGHDDLRKKYIDDQKTGVSADPPGEGPDRLVRAAVVASGPPGHPGLDNLNKYADLLKTSESGGRAQLLDGDPSFVPTTRR